MDNNHVLLELDGIDKRFGGVHALDNVSFQVNKGEVHAIVGENGAGKSTLMKILAGSYQPDRGTIKLDGKEVVLNNPRDSYAVGINIIYQEFYNFPALSVLANIYAGREQAKGGFLTEEAMRLRAEEVLNLMGIQLDLDATVKNLSLAEQQMVEIVKALVYEGSLLIMDEPNSSLTDKETQALFDIIRRLKAQGITILYISHRLEEVFQISDRVTVIRDGKYIGTWKTAETTIPFVISQMIGRAFGSAFPQVEPVAPDAPNILEIRGLTKSGRLQDVDLVVRQGEVLGFAGLEGSGIRNLFHILFGLERRDSGEVWYLGKKVKVGHSGDAIRLGWGLIPANRRDHGLLIRWSVKENTTILILRRALNALGLIKDNQLVQTAEQYIERLNIATDSIDKKAFDLSGGNQQKIVIAKWLATMPKVLIMDDPTRGIDVGAKAEIYELIQELARQGIAILLSSSEIEEVLHLSHRVLVMRDGKIVKEFGYQEADKAEVMWYVSGDITEAEAAAALAQ